MLSMVDFIMSYYRIAIGSDLDACQSITVYIIVLNQTTALAKYIHTPLVAVVNLIFSAKSENYMCIHIFF
jgi:hypothetical protein